MNITPASVVKWSRRALLHYRMLLAFSGGKRTTVARMALRWATNDLRDGRLA